MVDCANVEVNFIRGSGWDGSFHENSLIQTIVFGIEKLILQNF